MRWPVSGNCGRKWHCFGDTINQWSVCRLSFVCQSHSKSSKSVPIDSTYGTFYWHSIVTMPLSCTISEIVNIDWCHTLEIWVMDHSSSLEMAPFDRLQKLTNSYLSSIVTMVISCIVSEIKRDIGRKSRFFIPLYITTPGKIFGRYWGLLADRKSRFHYLWSSSTRRPARRRRFVDCRQGKWGRTTTAGMPNADISSKQTRV